MPLDLDMGGNSWQKVRAWLGPSLGWVEVQVRPTRTITTGGAFNVVPGDSTIFINVAAAVTILLPDLRLWAQETAYQPATGFERALWIKDLGGNAAAFPITITPFGIQLIDTVVGSFSIVQNHQLLRLYPLNDLTGWYSG